MLIPLVNAENISGLLSGKDYCIGIFADCVVLDGQGFLIPGTESRKGILVQANNVTITNVSISRYYYGMSIDGSHNNISNNAISSNKNRGISLWKSNNTIIAKNAILNNECGMCFNS